jgi:hypothetical protein
MCRRYTKDDQIGVSDLTHQTIIFRIHLRRIAGDAIRRTQIGI